MLYGSALFGREEWFTSIFEREKEKDPRHDHTDHCSLLYCRVKEVVSLKGGG